MTASGGFVAMEKMALHEADRSVKKVDLIPPAPKISITGPMNVLLVGIDPRDNPSDARSDSIIILHVPRNHDRAYLISIPRDSKVDIPAYPPARFTGSSGEKINAAFSYGSRNGQGQAGGFHLLAATVTRLTGIQINAGAIVNFDGFRALVNALGGVHLCIDQTVTSIHIGIDRNGKVAIPYTETSSGALVRNWDVKPVVYKPGCRTLAPWEALDYVRQRELLVNLDGTRGNGDYDRQRHQQQFIKAVFSQALTKGLTNPLKAKSIIQAAGSAFTVDLNGQSLETWLNSVIDVKQMIMVKSNAGRYNSEHINGVDYEILSPDTMTMLKSVASDTVDGFLATHPDWETKS